ncbi:unnamed protein product [Closterium sp. NIES-65]|nr:unnamed protein product [Closterium sp. NIES-65]
MTERQNEGERLEEMSGIQMGAERYRSSEPTSVAAILLMNTWEAVGRQGGHVSRYDWSSLFHVGYSPIRLSWRESCDQVWGLGELVGAWDGEKRERMAQMEWAAQLTHSWSESCDQRATEPECRPSQQPLHSLLSLTGHHRHLQPITRSGLCALAFRMPLAPSSPHLWSSQPAPADGKTDLSAGAAGLGGDSEGAEAAAAEGRRDEERGEEGEEGALLWEVPAGCAAHTPVVLWEPSLWERTGPEPSRWERTGLEPSLWERTGPEPSLWERTGPEPSLRERTGPEPSLWERTGPEPSLRERTVPMPSLWERTGPEPSLWERTGPEPSLRERHGPEPSLGCPLGLMPT